MDERALVWAVGRDGPLTCRFLAEEGLDTLACRNVEELCNELLRGAGVVIIAGELLSDEAVAQLRACIARQPPWSDIPIIVVAGTPDEGSAPITLFEDLGSVAVLHRPLSLDTLASGVRAALRARRRQYQVRDLLQQREEAERRREEFLAMLAHELRNPLAPIRTGLQVLRLSDSKDMTDAHAFHHRAAGRQPVAPGRRPARRLAHHARHDCLAQRARTDFRAAQAGCRRSCSARRRKGVEPRAHRARRAAVRRCRPHASRADGRQRAHQRDQVHAPQRRDRVRGSSRRPRR